MNGLVIQHYLIIHSLLNTKHLNVFGIFHFLIQLSFIHHVLLLK